MICLHVAIGCGLECGEIELSHCEHGVQHPTGLGFVWVGQERIEDVRDDLPGHTEFIAQPAAFF